MWDANFRAGLAVKHALVHPEHVAGGEDHAERGPGGPGEVGDGGSLQHQEFADEIVERGQADAGQGGDQEGGGEPRRDRGHTAVVGDFERVTPLIQDADEEEERAGGDAVIEHLVDRAIESRAG